MLFLPDGAAPLEFGAAKLSFDVPGAELLEQVRIWNESQVYSLSTASLVAVENVSR